MLKELGKKLKNIFELISSKSFMDDETLEKVLKDVKIALLQADVNPKLVDELCSKLKDGIKGKIPPGLTLKEHLIKLLYDELTAMFGKGFELKLDKKPYILMLVGLEGSGKTTSCAKLALWFKQKGFNPALVCLDPYRPASYEQLKQLAQEINVPVYGENVNDPIRTAAEALKVFEKKDVIILDLAGRHKKADHLMKELENLIKAIKPDHVMLVLDSTIGQQAYEQAKAFRQVCKIGSLLVTKLDSSSRAGGALAACKACDAPISFIAIGENLEDLEPYEPKAFISRVLGIGDIEGLIRKLERLEKPKVEAKGFNLQTLLEQLQTLDKLGPLSKIASFLPGFLDIPEEFLNVQKQKLKRWKAMIQSMTQEERIKPEIINASRISRIAKGSGTNEQEVRELLKHFKLISKLFTSTKPKDLEKLMRRFGFNFNFEL